MDYIFFVVKNKKAKGSGNERELFHMLWENSWACVRIAGSGSTTKPAPDLLAGNSNRKIAIECKSLKGEKQYFEKKEIEDLLEFSKTFGAEAWVGVRFDHVGWRFLLAENLTKTKGENFVASFDFLEKNGMKFEELIGKFKQERLI